MRKILALILILSFLLVGCFSFYFFWKPAEPLKGVLCNWRLRDLQQAQIDVVASSGANTFAFFMNRDWYTEGTSSYDSSYHDTVKNVCDMCRKKSLNILIIAYDGLSDSFTTETRLQKYARIIADENMTQQWIAAWSTIIKDLKPDAFSILWQAPDANSAGCENIANLTYARYKVFAQECIKSFGNITRAPGQDDLIIYMTSMPFSNMYEVTADPDPISGSNIFYYFPLYGQLSIENAPDYEKSYNTSDLPSAKTQLHNYTLVKEHISDALNKSLNVAVVVSADNRTDRIMTTGSDSGLNNADAFLDDVYQLCKDNHIESIFQGGFNSDNYDFGMWNQDLTRLNVVGNAWLRNMPRLPTSPLPSYIWFLLVGVAVAMVVLVYYARFRRKGRTNIEKEARVNALPLDHWDRARSQYTNDVIDRQRKIKRFEGKYRMTIRPSEKFEDALVKIGVPLSTQDKKKKPVQV